MKRLIQSSLVIGTGILYLSVIAVWLGFFLKGRRFALRDKLQHADAIVVLAGTRGNIEFLNGKLRTAVRLCKTGWAPYIICSGRFSVKVTTTPNLISDEEIQDAVIAGRIQEKDVKGAVKTWDIGLGAEYMREQAIHMGISQQAVLVEQQSLHTRENAEYVLALLKKCDMHSIILVTSPFHQLRTYLTFAKVFQQDNIKILNYYAETNEWHPASWFLSTKNRKLVKSEVERIKTYREKGDLL